MKYFIVVNLLLLAFVISAQNKIIDEYDYFSWNNLNEEEAQYITSNITRAYQHENSPYIKWEIIQQTGSTFQYLEYKDSSHIPFIIGQTILVDSLLRVDSLVFLNPETFAETPLNVEVRQKYLIKHGHWVEIKNGFRYIGQYQHNKKVGKWCMNGVLENLGNHQELIYQNDSLISQRQLNLALIHNKDSIKHYLIKKHSWAYMDYISDSKVYFESRKTRPLIIFYDDNTFKMIRKGCYRPTKPLEEICYNWHITDDYHLLLDFSNHIIELKIIDAYINNNELNSFLTEIIKRKYKD